MTGVLTFDRVNSVDLPRSPFTGRLSRRRVLPLRSEVGQENALCSGAFALLCSDSLNKDRERVFLPPQ